MKAVLDTKQASNYDDDVFRHYHFPRRYLKLVENTVGDWVVLRRPRDGGNLAYFAVARVSAIEPDAALPGMSYARYSDFMEFDTPVPWRVDGVYAEQALRDIDVKNVGRYLQGRSVRHLAETDFQSMIGLGFEKTLHVSVAEQFGLPSAPIDEFRQSLQEPPQERVWKIEQSLTNRVVRDVNFRRQVCDAYKGRCAFTRLSVFDDFGQPECQAAHIWPVMSGGPDIVQNGIALSATVHWLFDRHLLSLTDDHKITIRDDGMANRLATLGIYEGKTILLPSDRAQWPHPTFIRKHRGMMLDKSG